MLLNWECLNYPQEWLLYLVRRLVCTAVGWEWCDSQETNSSLQVVTNCLCYVSSVKCGGRKRWVVFRHRSMEHWIFLKALGFCLFVFVRKIGPELTSITPPLFAEKDWPWVNIHAHLPPLYMGCHHTMAWQAVRRCAPRIRTGEPWAAAAERTHLTASPPSWPWRLFVFFLMFINFDASFT